MPRLSKEVKLERAAKLKEWSVKFYKTILDLAKKHNNFVQRTMIITSLPGFPVNLYQQVTNLLMEEGKITKAGAERGRGSGWAVMSLPLPIIENVKKTIKTATPSKEKEKIIIKLAGPFVHFASALLRARAGVDSVVIVEDESDADYFAKDKSSSCIIDWYNRSVKNKL